MHDGKDYDSLCREFSPPDTRLRRFLRRMAYATTLLLVLEGVAIVRWGDQLLMGSSGRIVAMVVIAVTWLLMWVGYTGWLFEYCWQGFKRKKIWVPSADFYEGAYAGKAAQAWAIIGMNLAIVFFALAMAPVFFLDS